MNTKEKEQIVRDKTYNFLMSDDVKQAAKNARKKYKKEMYTSNLLIPPEILNKFTKTVKREIFPEIVKIGKHSVLPNGSKNHVSPPFVVDFLSRFACSSISHEKLVDIYTKLLLEAVLSNTVTLRSVVALSKFSCRKRFFIKGQINNRPYQCTIVRNRWRHPIMNSFWGFRNLLEFQKLNDTLQHENLSDWSLQIDIEFPKQDNASSSAGCDEQRILHRAIIRALRLFQDGAVDGPMSFGSNSSFGGGSKNTFHERVILGNTYKLDNIGKFKKFWSKNESWLLLSSIPPRIEHAISYFESSYTKINDWHKYFDLCIAMECLYDIGYELSYRLKIRVAALLETNDLFGEHLSEWMKIHTKIRNHIAHGNTELRKSTNQRTILTMLPQLRELTRKSILRYVDIFMKSEQNIDIFEKKIEDFEEVYIFPRLTSKKSQKSRR